MLSLGSRIWLEGFLVITISNLQVSLSTLLKPAGEDVYKHYRLEDLCPGTGEKRQLNINTDVSVFKLNSSKLTLPLFKCHLELEVTNSNYGFSVFIEEMMFSGDSGTGCQGDYLQFGRDIFFVTSHRSGKYCGDVEPPVTTISQGLTGFNFPYTPLVRRIYTEEKDKDMDVWLKVSTQDTFYKTLTLVVTPFKKFCGVSDLEYRQCRYSTKCVRKELFCDGRINCAWPYAEPADEVYCKDISSSNQSLWNSSNIPVIVLVTVVILGALSLLCVGLAKLTKKVKKFNDYYSEDPCLSEAEPGHSPQPQDFAPSCPPAPDRPPSPLTHPPPGFRLQAVHQITSSANNTPAIMHTLYQPPPPPYSPPRSGTPVRNIPHPPRVSAKADDHLPPFPAAICIPDDDPPKYSSLAYPPS